MKGSAPAERCAYIGVDQGTRSSKVVVVNQKNVVLHEAVLPVQLYGYGEGQFEQDPNELLNTVDGLLSDATDFCAREQYTVGGVGLALQRSGVCAWQRESGEVSHQLLSWADTRTEDRIKKLGDSRQRVVQLTTLPVTPHYAAGKIALLQEKFKDLDTIVGTLDTFLVYRLTQRRVFATEDAMASRTMLVESQKAQWSPELCALFGVDQSRLAPIASSLRLWGDVHGVPLRAVLGDQQASLIGRYQKDSCAALTLGSSASLGVLVGKAPRIEAGYVTTYLFSRELENGKREVTYFLESLGNACANLIEHAVMRGEVFGDLSKLSGVCYDARNEADGLVAYMPWGGSASPHWLYGVKDVFDGDPTGSDQQYIRAVIENIAGFVVYNLKELQQRGVLPQEGGKILVTGGVSQIDYLLQFIADCTGYILVRSSSEQGTARGAAVAASMQAHGTSEIPEFTPAADDRIFKPEVSEALSRYKRWCELQRKVLCERQ